MGRKNIRTDRPREKVDTKILEVVVELEPSPDLTLPLGLEVTATFLEPAAPAEEVAAAHVE